MSKETALAMMDSIAKEGTEAAPVTPAPAPEAVAKPEGTTEPTTETATEPEKPKDEPAKDARESDAWAKLTKKESKLREEREAFEEERKKAKELEADVLKMKDVLGKLHKSPLEALEQVGLTPEKLQQLIDAKKAGINPRIEKLDATVEDLQSWKEKMAEDQKKQAAQAEEGYKKAIETVTATPEKFPHVHHTGAQADVFELTRLTFEKNGTILPFEVACQMTEDYLIEMKSKLLKASAKKETPPEKPETPKEEPKKEVVVSQPTTNTQGASVNNPQIKTEKPWAERRAELAKNSRLFPG